MRDDAIITAATVVTERASRIRDGMQVMGLEDSSFYAALFLSFALYHLPIYAIGAHWLLSPPGTRSGMSLEQLFPYSNVAFVFALLWLLVQATFHFSLAVSTISFRREVAVVGIIVLLSLAQIFADFLDPGMPLGTRFLLAILFPPINVCLSTTTLFALEDAT